MKMFKKIERLIKTIPWLPLILAMVIVLLSDVGGGILDEIFKSLAHNISIGLRLMIIVSIIFILIVWLYHLRGMFSPVRTLASHLCEPHQGLILLLSYSIIPVSINSFPQVIKNQSGQEAELRGGSLAEDIVALNNLNKPWWNWQQLLRGLTPHLKTLKIVYLIGSKDTIDENGKIIIQGSYKDKDNAVKLISQYFPHPHIEIKILEKAIDFEDLEEIMESITVAITYIKKKGIKEKDIIIDVTGGQKTTSIAGAVVTMNKQVTFQYVQTQGNYQVIAYDVAILPEVSAGE